MKMHPAMAAFYGEMCARQERDARVLDLATDADARVSVSQIIAERGKLMDRIAASIVLANACGTISTGVRLSD